MPEIKILYCGWDRSIKTKAEAYLEKIEYQIYVIVLSHTGKGAIKDSAKSHAAYLKNLYKAGQLILDGPFSDHKGGMVIVKAGLYEEAIAC